MVLDPKDICVLMLYDDYYAKLAEVTIDKNVKQYCDLHGYTLISHKIENIDNGRSPQWQKIQVSIDVLKTNKFKWLFFLDTDCLIMNSTIKLESIIDDNYSFIVPAHNIEPIDTPIKNNQGTNCVITSQYFVKNDKTGIDILQDIWDAKEWPIDIDINTFDYEGRQARITIDKPIFKDKVKIVPEKTLNRFWYMNNPFMVLHTPGANNNVWQPGDFIVHVTGYNREDRINLTSDLNYFTGGLLYNFHYNGDNRIDFSSLLELDNVKIVMYYYGDILFEYTLPKVLPKIIYNLYYNPSFPQNGLLIKGFDKDNNLISLKSL